MNTSSVTSRRTSGFTLVELLVGMGLMGVVMATVLSVNISSSRASLNLQTRNDLIPETQISQNYLVGKIREATYVFPTGTVINLGSDSTVQNPRTGTGSWTVGDDAIIAVVLPPRRDPLGATPPNCPATAPTTPDIENCYTLYAYYPVKRSQLTPAAITSGRRLTADSLNDGAAWALMEYRRSYNKLAQTTVATTFTFPAADTTTKGSLVMDYLVSVTLPQTSTVATRLFSLSNDTPTQIPGSTTVTVNLAAQRVITGGNTIRVPGADRYSVTVFPRNLGKGIGVN